MNNGKTSVLLVKMSSLGDLIHSFPAVSDVKAILGDKLELDWLVDEQYAQVPRLHAAVSTVVPIALRRWRRKPGPGAAGELMSYLYKLRLKRYDVVIDAQGLLKSVLLGSLPARGPSNGYTSSSVREKAACLFYGKAHAIEANQHAIERTRHLLAKSIGYKRPTSTPDYGLKPTRKKDGKKKIVLVTCCARPEKRWHDDQWVLLAKHARGAAYEVELTWGSPAEQKQAERLAKAAGAALAPELSLVELPSYLSQASGVVSLDTGLAHITAACQVPNVCLCTSTDPALSGAFGKNQLSVGNASELGADQAWRKLQSLLAQDPAKKQAVPKQKSSAP